MPKFQNHRALPVDALKLAARVSIVHAAAAQYEAPFELLSVRVLHLLHFVCFFLTAG